MNKGKISRNEERREKAEESLFVLGGNALHEERFPALLDEVARMEWSRLISIARKMLGSSEDAEDAVQTSFLKAMRARHTFIDTDKCHANMAGWLRTIVTHTAIDMCREKKRRGYEDTRDVYEVLEWRGMPSNTQGLNPETIVLVQESNEALYQALLALADHEQRIAFLYYWEGQKIEEIGKQFGMNKNTVKSKLCRLRKKLSEILNEQEYIREDDRWED